MAGAGRIVRAGGAAAVVAVCAVGACTAFNGVQVTPPSGLDAMPPDVSVDNPGLPETFVPPPDVRPPPPADAGPDATPQLGYLTQQQAAQLCTLNFACPQLYLSALLSIDVPLDQNNFSLCMQWASGPIPPDRVGFVIQQQVLQCMAQAPDCLTAAACNPIGILAGGDPRCQIAADAATESGTYCTDNGRTALDCAVNSAAHCDKGNYTPGTSCIVDSMGFAWCALPVDSGCPGSSSCITTFEDYCGMDGLHFRYNCATVGSNCNVEAGISNCGAACTTAAVQCAGTSVQVCDELELTTFDCPALGSACSSANNLVYCKGPSDTCTPGDPAFAMPGSACSGTNIKLCVGGQQITFDCGSIGKKCVT